MILADTTIWIDHLRRQDARMEELLRRGQILMHPWIVAELSLGSLRDRRNFLAALDGLFQANVASLNEVRQFIEARKLYAMGIGLTDAQLVASCLITPGTKLWTRDAALNRVALALGIAAGLP